MGQDFSVFTKGAGPKGKALGTRLSLYTLDEIMDLTSFG